MVLARLIGESLGSRSVLSLATQALTLRLGRAYKVLQRRHGQSGPTGRVQQRTVEHVTGSKEIVEVVFSHKRAQRIDEQKIPQITKEIVEEVKLVPQARVQRIDEQNLELFHKLRRTLSKSSHMNHRSNFRKGQVRAISDVQGKRRIS